MNRILNKRTDDIPEDAVYVGRPSPLGNPYVIGKDGNRDEVIDKYHRLFYDNHEMRAYARKHCRGKALVCWCAPERCHAEVIARYLSHGD